MTNGTPTSTRPPEGQNTRRRWPEERPLDARILELLHYEPAVDPSTWSPARRELEQMTSEIPAGNGDVGLVVWEFLTAVEDPQPADVILARDEELRATVGGLRGVDDAWRERYNRAIGVMLRERAELGRRRRAAAREAAAAARRAMGGGSSHAPLVAPEHLRRGEELVAEGLAIRDRLAAWGAAYQAFEKEAVMPFALASDELAEVARVEAGTDVMYELASQLVTLLKFTDLVNLELDDDDALRPVDEALDAWRARLAELRP